MGLFTPTEYAVLTLGVSGTLRAGRLRRCRKQLLLTHAAELPPDDRTLDERIREIVRKVEIRPDHILILSGDLPDAAFFRCRLPVMNTREMASALEFEAQQQLLMLPTEFRLQFTTRPLPDNEVSASVCVFPAGRLVELCRALAGCRLRADDYLYPLLALPELPEGELTRLPEFDPQFCWRGDSPYPAAGRGPFNQALLAGLKNEVVRGPKCDCRYGELAENFITVLLVGKFAMSPAYRTQRSGFSVIPEALRPRRNRSLLQLAVVLGVVLLGIFGFRALGAVMSFNARYSAVRNRIESTRKRTANHQRRLRTRDKELKEMNRINELNLGHRNLMGNMAQLSEALPSQALVSSMRWSENGVEMVIMTAQQNFDPASALRKYPAYKVTNLQTRKINDTLQMINLKLSCSQTTGGGGK